MKYFPKPMGRSSSKFKYKGVVLLALASLPVPLYVALSLRNMAAF